jgi:hypothetical protein
VRKTYYLATGGGMWTLQDAPVSSLWLPTGWQFFGQIRDCSLREPDWLRASPGEKIDHAPDWPTFAPTIGKVDPMLISTMIVPISRDQTRAIEDFVLVSSKRLPLGG